MLAGYARKKRRYSVVFFVSGLVLGIIIGCLFGKPNPVRDILNAHSEGVIYGLYASQDEDERVLALTAAKAWKEIAKDEKMVKDIYRKVSKRQEPLHLAVVLEALESLNSSVSVK